MDHIARPACFPFTALSSLTELLFLPAVSHRDTGTHDGAGRGSHYPSRVVFIVAAVKSADSKQARMRCRPPHTSSGRRVPGPGAGRRGSAGRWMLPRGRSLLESGMTARTPPAQTVQPNVCTALCTVHSAHTYGSGAVGRPEMIARAAAGTRGGRLLSVCWSVSQSGCSYIRSLEEEFWSTAGGE